MPSLLPDAAEIKQIQADLEARTLPDTCVLLTATSASDGQGGLVDTWAAAGTVACRLDNTSGSRRPVAASVRPFSGWVLTVPMSADISTAVRVEHGDHTYSVIAVSDTGSWLGIQRAQLERIE